MQAELPPSHKASLIILVLVLNVLMFLGINAARVTLSLYGLSLGANAAVVGAIMATIYLCPLLLSWSTGQLVDRIGGVRPLAFGQVAGCVGMTIPFWFPSIASLYVAAISLGLILTVVGVVGQYMIGALSEPHERTRNLSNYTVSGAVAACLGPSLTGFSIDALGHGVTCLLVALAFLSSFFLLLLRRKDLPRGRRSAQRAPTSLRDALRDRALWKLLIVCSLAQLSADLLQVFLPVYGHQLGMSASLIGTLLSASAIGAIGIRLALPSMVQRFGETRLLHAVFWVAAAVFFAVPLLNSPWALALLCFVFGATAGCSQPLTMVLIHNSASEGRAGEAIGLRMTANNVARLAGPAALGALGAVAGLLSVFWISSALMGLASQMSRSVAQYARHGKA